jgi:hypothetical protein
MVDVLAGGMEGGVLFFLDGWWGVVVGCGFVGITG